LSLPSPTAGTGLSRGRRPFEGIGFDLGETLVEYAGVPLDWQGGYPRALAAVASLWAGSLTATQVEAGCAVLRGYNTRLLPRRREVASATVFAEVFAALGVPAADARALLEPAADAFFDVFQRRARAYPDVPVALRTLEAAGASVGVLTDVPYGMPRRLVLRDLAAAGLEALAASLLTSGETGVRKPDPAGFEALARHLGCSPGAMLFVGNEQKDVDGARAAGMATALLWRGDSPAPPWGQDLTWTSLAQAASIW